MAVIWTKFALHRASVLEQTSANECFHSSADRTTRTVRSQRLYFVRFSSHFATYEVSGIDVYTVKTLLLAKMPLHLLVDHTGKVTLSMCSPAGYTVHTRQVSYERMRTDFPTTMCFCYARNANLLPDISSRLTHARHPRQTCALASGPPVLPLHENRRFCVMMRRKLVDGHYKHTLPFRFGLLRATLLSIANHSG